MIGHRCLPQRSLEPLQMTHKPLFESVAVTVRLSSWLTPECFSMLCSHVSEYLPVCCGREKLNVHRSQSWKEGILMLSGSSSLSIDLSRIISCCLYPDNLPPQFAVQLKKVRCWLRKT
jgi:hypothetical protein